MSDDTPATPPKPSPPPASPRKPDGTAATGLGTRPYGERVFHLPDAPPQSPAVHASFDFAELIDVELPPAAIPHDGDEVDPTVMADNVVRDRIRRAWLRLTPMGALSERQVDYLVLLIHLGLGPGEAANVLGLTVNAIDQSLTRIGLHVNRSMHSVRADLSRYYWIEYGRDTVLSAALTPGFGA